MAMMKRLFDNRPQVLHTSATATVPGDADQQTALYTLSFIVQSLMERPRTQFNVYYSSKMHPSMQRELVSYRVKTRGYVRRTCMSSSQGTQISSAATLYRQLLQDLQQYQNCFFTFMTSPAIGLTEHSENRNYLARYQSLDMKPVSYIKLS